MKTTTAKVTAKNTETGQIVTKKSSGWVSAGRAYTWAREEASKLESIGYGEIKISWF